MDYLFHVDWPALFIPKMSVLEMIIRGTATYVGLCLLLRAVLKRQAGKVALSDLLVVTVVAGVCRNPLVQDAYSLTDGLGIIAVVLGCSYLLDLLSYYSPLCHRLLHPDPVELIHNGHVLHDHLRRELITQEQLHSKLRGTGVDDPRKVRQAWLEGNGEVSVIRASCPESVHANGRAP